MSGLTNFALPETQISYLDVTCQAARVYLAPISQHELASSPRVGY